MLLLRPGTSRPRSNVRRIGCYVIKLTKIMIPDYIAISFWQMQCIVSWQQSGSVSENPERPHTTRLALGEEQSVRVSDSDCLPGGGGVSMKSVVIRHTDGT